MEDGVTSESSKLSVADLVTMFEAAEEASLDSRKEAERDRDYHDNKQLTSEELKALRKRGQPPYVDNRIKTKIDYLVGLEKQQRINPRALPRTPAHEADADAAGQALNYVADAENFDYKRSACWRNLLVEGACGIGVTVKQRVDGEWYVCLKRISWDRMFWDPHSGELDFSDAGYLGTVQWLDYDEAVEIYSDNPDARDILDATLTGSPSLGDTYDDKPKWNVWADRKRRRVRVVAMWIKQGEDWFFAEFTKGGILKAGPSPYLDDQGRSDCELVFQSAYVDRDNNRFGLVREMISLQDAINKRNSKALHQLNTAQIVMTQDALDGANNIEKVRREAARPDGVILLNPSSQGLKDRFEFNTRSDLAAGQVTLLQEAKQSIDLKGPNATQMGEKTSMGSSSASGKAILASQQGGMISLGDLLDNLRHLDLRVFRAVWNRIRQFWTEEKWIRVTDDDRNVRWVGLNVDPYAQQAYASRGGNRIAGMISAVAELDCDIIIDESPLAPQAEQFTALVDLKRAGVAIPDKALIRSMPNFQGKQQMLKEMEQPDPMAQIGQRMQLEAGKSEIDNTKADTAKKQAEAARIAAEAQSAGGEARTQAMQMFADRESRAMDRAAAAEDRQFRREEHAMDMQSEEVGLVKDLLSLQQQRERLQQPPRAV